MERSVSFATLRCSDRSMSDIPCGLVRERGDGRTGWVAAVFSYSVYLTGRGERDVASDVSTELAAEEPSEQSVRQRRGMRRQDGNLSQDALRFMEDAELAKDGAAVIVDFFSGQAVVRVEGIDSAEWEFDAPSGGWKATPRAKVRATNDDFEKDRVAGDMAALDVDLQIGQRAHDLFVEGADPVAAFVMFAPGLVIVVGGVAEGEEDSFEVMRILEAHMFFNDRDAGCRFVLRNGCGGHMHLPAIGNLGVDDTAVRE